MRVKVSGHSGGQLESLIVIWIEIVKLASHSWRRHFPLVFLLKEIMPHIYGRPPFIAID